MSERHTDHTVTPRRGRVWPTLDRPDAVVTAVLVIGVVLLTAFRLYLSLHRTGPVIVADEVGYLVNARVLTGGPDGYLNRANVYAGGYSLALVPAFLLGTGPEEVYQLVLGTNAVLSALLLPLLYLLLRRGFGVARAPAALCGLAGALYAPISGFTEVALSENLLAPLLVAWLLCVVEFARARNRAWASVNAVAVGLLTGSLYATHSRTLPLIPIVLATLVLLAARRHVQPALALLGIGATLSSCVGAYLLNAYLYRQSWPGKVLDQQDRALGNLFSMDGLPERAQFVAGQSAYLFLASFGLAGVGMVALTFVGCGSGTTSVRERLRSAWRRGTSTGLDSERTRMAAAWIVLLVAAGILGLTGAATSGDFTRPDHRIYGRYIEIITPLLLALGLAAISSWLPTAAPRWVLWCAGVALTSLATVVTIDGADDAFDATNIGWANVSGLMLLGGMRVIDPARSAVACILVFSAIALLARGRMRVVGALGTSLFLVWGSVHIDTVFYEPRQDRYYPSSVTVDDFPAIAAADHVAFDASVTGEAEFIYQFYLDHTTVELFDSRTKAPPADADVVISTASWPGGDAQGVQRIWTDPVLGVTAWRLG